jgi:hypothetical protein
MSSNSQNTSTRAMTTSSFDVAKQKQQQQYYSSMMPGFSKRFDIFFLRLLNYE